MFQQKCSCGKTYFSDTITGMCPECAERAKENENLSPILWACAIPAGIFFAWVYWTPGKGTLFAEICDALFTVLGGIFGAAIVFIISWFIVGRIFVKGPTLKIVIAAIVLIAVGTFVVMQKGLF